MAQLFNREDSNIRRHVLNIFKEQELSQENNVHFLHVIGVKKPVPFYNLDVIISVGYRVHSQQGIAFRQWATRILKEYMLRGYSINQHLVALQQNMDTRFFALEQKVQDQQQQVEFLVNIHRTDDKQLFPTGCVFDAWNYISSLIRTATKQITLIDNYCDERTLSILAKRTEEVNCTIHTRFTETFNTDLEKHNRQYPPINKVQLSHKEHDRFLIIDDTVYILGDSLKDPGHSLTTVLKTTFSPQQILSALK